MFKIRNRCRVRLKCCKMCISFNLDPRFFTNKLLSIATLNFKSVQLIVQTHPVFYKISCGSIKRAPWTIQGSDDYNNKTLFVIGGEGGFCLRNFNIPLLYLHFLTVLTMFSKCYIPFKVYL